MKTKACNVITKIWNIAQTKCNGTPIAATKALAEYITAIRMKINSPAYILPNKRKARETGFEIKVTDSNSKFNGNKSPNVKKDVTYIL